MPEAQRFGHPNEVSIRGGEEGALKGLGEALYKKSHYLQYNLSSSLKHNYTENRIIIFESKVHKQVTDC